MDNIIDRHRGNDNTILFAMDEVELRRIKGLPWKHYKEQFVEHWNECYVKPGLYLRAKDHGTRQSHDNIFAWFRCFKVFGLSGLSEKLIRELDVRGWQLLEVDGHSIRTEGLMPPFLEVFCRMIHAGNISPLCAIYLTLHMVHSKFKTTWNLEFHRQICIKEIGANTLPGQITKILSIALYGRTKWEDYALDYHGEGSDIGKIIKGVIK